MIPKQIYILGFITAFICIGCQTSPVKNFEKVKVGMDKGEVLEIMGSPQYTQRWQGKDRWTYTFYEQDLRHEKEVHFEEGKATYAGNLYQPPLTAEEQDKINLELQKKLGKKRP